MLICADSPYNVVDTDNVLLVRVLGAADDSGAGL